VAKKTQPTSPSGTTASETGSTDGLEGRLVAYAEQLGWVVGTVHAKAEGWLDRAALEEHLTRIRDGAADLLTHLADALPDSSASKGPGRGRRGNPDLQQTRLQGRSGGIVDAPGKRHRPPPPSARGVKHSDQHISKLKAAAMKNRRGGRG
jgi:hypothetical protein